VVSEKYLNYQAVVGSVPVEVRYRPRELLTAAKALGERLVEPDDRPLLDILRFWSNVIDELVIDGRPVKTSMHTQRGADGARDPLVSQAWGYAVSVSKLRAGPPIPAGQEAAR